MILTTTKSIEHHKIVDYLGIVSGVQLTSFKVAFTAEKMNSKNQEVLNNAKEEAFQQLRRNAMNLGANAVVGITVDIELTSYIVVTISGTAVKVA